MSFALTFVKLEEALKKKGCPVCALNRQAAESAVKTLLWEHVNDSQSRQPFINAYGFCPPHTRLFVATEMFSSGPLLGVNIMYEQLGRNVSRELQTASQQQKMGGVFQRLLQRLGIKIRSNAPLQPKGACPVCAQVFTAANNSLAALFEALEKEDERMMEFYRNSEGLCLAHLRQGLQEHGHAHPRAAQCLVLETRQRLEHVSQDMREYLRKNNWEYRDENITPQENNAWRRMLTFFTGLPGDEFTMHFKE